MKDDVRSSLKDLTWDLICGNEAVINDNHEIGFTISKFILIKENMIKKKDISGDERIVFNVDENFKYLNSINQFAMYIRNNKVDIKYGSDIEMIGVYSKGLKENIEIIHIIRNSLAHDKYQIDNGFIKINNPGHLVCDIELSVFENFNDEIINLRSNIPDVPTNIFDIFCKSDIDDLLYMSLYSYMVMSFSKLDDLDIDYLKLKSVYMNPNFIDEKHAYNSSKRSLISLTDRIPNVKSSIDCYDDYPSYNHFEGVRRSENNSFGGISSSIYNMHKEQVRSIRNSIEHGNVFVSDGRLTLVDMPDQDDVSTVSYQINNDVENFFALTKDIDEEKISDDDYCFLNGIFMILDNSYLEKLEILSELFKTIENGDNLFLFNALEFENIFTGNEFTIYALENIIDCLKNPYKQKNDILTLYNNLENYLESAYCLLFNFRIQILEMKEGIDELLQMRFDDDLTIPEINRKEMLLVCKKYSSLLELLEEALLVIDDLKLGQEKSFTLINNHNRIEQIDKSYILMQ